MGFATSLSRAPASFAICHQDRNTFLHHAAEHGQTDPLRYLIARKADVFARNSVRQRQLYGGCKRRTSLAPRFRITTRLVSSGSQHSTPQRGSQQPLRRRPPSPRLERRSDGREHRKLCRCRFRCHRARADDDVVVAYLLLPFSTAPHRSIWRRSGPREASPSCSGFSRSAPPFAMYVQLFVASVSA